MTHALKCLPEYFKALDNGDKTFELRKDDRPFNAGDKIILQEWEPKAEKYTGEELTFNISYVLRDAPKFGLKPGFCILGLHVPSKPKE